MRYMVGESEVLMCSSRDRETTEVFFMSLTDSQNLQDTHTHTHTHTHTQDKDNIHQSADNYRGQCQIYEALNNVRSKCVHNSGLHFMGGRHNLHINHISQGGGGGEIEARGSNAPPPQ